jgi:hypothetical protein
MLKLKHPWSPLVIHLPPGISICRTKGFRAASGEGSVERGAAPQDHDRDLRRSSWDNSSDTEWKEDPVLLGARTTNPSETSACYN